MIEYALLFGLGFLTAILTGMLFAPLIHRRIVKFTEDRIMATMPVSPQELRAQKDMVRAEMAVAVARTGHDLREVRHKAAEFSIRNDALVEEASRLHGENVDLRTIVEELNVQAGELRASVREEEMRAEQIRGVLVTTQHSERMKDARIDELLHRVQRLSSDVDNLKIDLVTRDTEAESFRARINALRDERESLRTDVRALTQRTKDAELRLAREENRAIKLADKLNAEVSGSDDKDTIIERRVSEINRLKERLRSANAGAREAARVSRTGTEAQPDITTRLRPGSPVMPNELPASIAPEPIISPERAAELSDDVRTHAAAAADVLLRLTDEESDEAMRTEIAEIAAKMVAVVGQKDGAKSPIHKIIAGKPGKGQSGRVALAERASKLLYQE